MFFRILRLILAVGILVVVVRYAGWSSVVDVIQRLQLRYVPVLLLLTAVLIWISCVKWQLFIRAAGHSARVLHLMRIYTTSYFFNLFLPSIVGGDVARSVQLGKEFKNYQNVFIATFTERFTGFLAMNLIGVIFVALGAQVTKGVEAAVLAVAFCTLAAALVLYSHGLSQLAKNLVLKFLRLIGLKTLSRKFEKLLAQMIAAMEFIRANDRLFWLAMFYSVLFHFFAVVNTYVAALAIGWSEVSFARLCVVVPLVLLVSAAPITPSGIGVQESAFVYFLTRIGATAAEGLGVGLVLRAKGIVTACIGGLIWIVFRESDERRAKDGVSTSSVECNSSC